MEYVMEGGGQWVVINSGSVSFSLKIGHIMNHWHSVRVLSCHTVHTLIQMRCLRLHRHLSEKTKIYTEYSIEEPISTTYMCCSPLLLNVFTAQFIVGQLHKVGFLPSPGHLLVVDTALGRHLLLVDSLGLYLILYVHGVIGIT